MKCNRPRKMISYSKVNKTVLTVAILLCLSTLYIWFYNSASAIIVFEDYALTIPESSDFLVDTEGCVIPNLNPFDPSIKKFIFQESSVVCNNGIPALVSSNSTSIYLLNSSFPFYNITNENNLKCCYNSFARIPPQKNSGDNNVQFSQNCVRFKNSTNIDDEYIRVKCFYTTDLIYEDYFAFVPVKLNKTTQKKSGLNVLIVGLDSISRLNFIRQMPKTNQVLKDFGTIDFMGYNKVGDNTFPNLIPVLTGLNETELRKACWINNKERFDSCPFIWKRFKEQNFSTAFAEDASWMGLFNYKRKGFLEQPTDYYWGSFNYHAIKSIGNMYSINVHQCMGSTEDYVKLLEYTEKFVETMDKTDQRYFGLFWQSSLSHDILNKPKLGDNSYFNFLLRLKENGHLDNTVLFFMSDHGIRWGNIRTTFQGSMEERLPFLHIYLPSWYRKKFPLAYSNLVRNSRRLSTPFDLHDTLKDLLHSFELTDNFLTTRTNKLYQSHRSQSLFNLILKNRTCNSAGIPEHFCTCHMSKKVDTSDKAVKQVVEFSLRQINNKLENQTECTPLELVNILTARIQVSLDKISTSDLTVTFKTIPGEGIFEATVRKNDVNSKAEYQMLGDISRLNLYGNQSSCVEDFHLKLFCYCR